ncbi:hypothetical protein FO433_02370 [Weissella cibaria]|uniref:hypothetical protein n=1 Tax=Weissella cibaria TaxID=137591 RepID=UPI000E4E9913|nr:hypothetical protein [Weissella cibaria]MDK9677302.1 hypothetical protein [Weissella cibaria]RHE73773.1 hypothetical protein DW718_00675 [Weissella cibaria]RHE79508.1 hypothetical protein DW717_00675 [Weissella cibaria]TVV24721.1 hypothetical protein FO433_02370 [Weissella cibaria]
MNDQGVVLLIWMVSAVVGTFMMLALYELGERFIQRVWLKSWGPRVYFAGRALIKGDVKVARK